jgi:hypothetical protein
MTLHIMELLSKFLKGLAMAPFRVLKRHRQASKYLSDGPTQGYKEKNGTF